MPVFLRHSSRCPAPTSGGLRPSDASPHRSRAVASRDGSNPTTSVPGSREFPSTAPQLSPGESRFPHPPSLRATGHSAIASDNSRYLYQPRQASWVYFWGFVFSRILRHHRALSRERRGFRATPRNIFKIRHRPSQGNQSTSSFSCGRMVILHPKSFRHFQIRHHTAQGNQPLGCHSLDVKIQSQVNELGFIRDATVSAGVCDQIVIQCNGSSHASKDATFDPQFQSFFPIL